MRTIGWGSRCALLVVCLAVAPVAADVNRWSSTGPEGGRIDDVAVDPSSPNTVYASSVAALFKSTDAGASWSPLDVPGFCPNGRYQLTVDATPPPTRLLVATGCGIASTHDGGTSWTEMAPIKAPLRGAGSIAVEPGAPDTLYAGAGNRWLKSPPGFFSKSTDGGSSWKVLSLDAGVAQAAVDPLQPNRVYAATYAKGIAVSEDRGETWTLGAGGTDNLDVLAVAADRTHPGHAYAATSDGLMVTGDGGATWTSVMLEYCHSGFCGPYTVYAEDVATTDAGAWAIEAGSAYRSTDGGVQWEEEGAYADGPPLSFAVPAIPKNVLAVAGGSDPMLYIGGSGSGVIAGRFGDEMFEHLHGLVATEVNSLGIEPASGMLFAGVIFGSDWRSADGETWESLPLYRPYPTIWSAGAGQPPIVWAGGLTDVSRSTDLGATWTEKVPVTAGGDGLAVLAAHPTEPLTAYAVSHRVRRTTDGGVTWDLIDTSPFPTTGAVRALLIDPNEPSVLYIDDWAGGSVSVDGGVHWTPVASTGEGWHGRLAIAPGSPTRLMTSGYGSDQRPHLFVSSDRGATWSTGPECPLNLQQLKVSPADTNRLYGADYNAVYTSRDGGENWYRLQRGVRADTYAWDLLPDPHRANVVHAGLGAYGVSTWEDRCGDGIVDAFEGCDDGNDDESDRCVYCQTPCVMAAVCDDGNACTDDTCDSSRFCRHDPVGTGPLGARCAVRDLVATQFCRPTGVPQGFAARLRRVASRIDDLAVDNRPGGRRKAVALLRNLADRALRTDRLRPNCAQELARALRATAITVKGRWSISPP